MEKTLLDAMQEGVGTGGLPSVPPVAKPVVKPVAVANEKTENNEPQMSATSWRLGLKVDRETGLSVRYCEGSRGFLNWQAGQMISEERQVPIHANSRNYVWQTFSLFQLLGYGWTRDEAIENALKNPNGRNGR